MIALPKTQKAQCPMTDAPSPVSPDQHQELRIELDKLEKGTGYFSNRKVGMTLADFLIFD